MKKSVGLITMHRVANHGSVLQALATQRAIEQLGHSCTIIDYAYPTDEHLRRIGLDWYPHERDLWQLIKKTLRGRESAAIYQRLERFYWFRKKYLKTTQKSYVTNEALKKDAEKWAFDVYCVGSDQVWNPKYTMDDGAFVLDFVPEGKRKISYASSFTVGEMADAKQREFYGDHLKSFDAIAVREQSGVALVKQLTGKEAKHVLDPVFLLTKEEWAKTLGIEVKKEKYVLFYSLNYMADTMPEMVKFVEKVMSEQKGLSKMVSNKGIKSGYDVEVVKDDKTKAFMERIANAEMVITDSFHASAFALLFGVPVYGFSESKCDERLLSLYKMLGVEEQFVGKGENKGMVSGKWNVEKIEKYIAQLRAESIAYLKEAIG